MVDEVILMEEMVIRVRNIVIAKLAATTGLVISLSDEQEPEAEPPYGYYSIITPYASTGEFGSHIRQVETDPDSGERYICEVRYEHPEMLLSLNFCSKSRKTPDGRMINGENEAMQYAMKAVGWLKHAGAAELSLEEIVVLRTSNCSSRSGIVGDEYVRRWGFDVALRYKSMTVNNVGIAESVRIYQKE